MFCSVDNNDTLSDSPQSQPPVYSQPHINIWKLENNLLSSAMLNSYRLAACLTQPHPVLHNVWAIAFNNKNNTMSSNNKSAVKCSIGLISSNLDSQNIASYDQLPVYLNNTSNDINSISDMSFSTDGHSLAVVYQMTTDSSSTTNTSKVVIYSIPDLPLTAFSSSTTAAAGGLHQVLIPQTEVSVSYLLCCQFLHSNSIALISKSIVSDTSKEIPLLLDIYHAPSRGTGGIGTGPLELVQSIKIMFPVYKESSLLLLSQGGHRSVLPSLSSSQHNSSAGGGGGGGVTGHAMEFSVFRTNHLKENFIVLSHR